MALGHNYQMESKVTSRDGQHSATFLLQHNAGYYGDGRYLETQILFLILSRKKTYTNDRREEMAHVGIKISLKSTRTPPDSGQTHTLLCNIMQ